MGVMATVATATTNKKKNKPGGKAFGHAGKVDNISMTSYPGQIGIWQTCGA